MPSVILEHELRIPLGLTGLEDFRTWARSKDFPAVGRIDYVGGNIEVEMSPEDLFTHGTVKTKIASAVLSRAEDLELGHIFTDSTRVSHTAADLSVEPDIVLISHEAIESGRVRLVPKSTADPDRFVEIQGAPDLIVEIISDASVTKDTERLHNAYYVAGVPEYWIVDARVDPLAFQIFTRGPSGYQPVVLDENGFQPSHVLGCRYRLDRHRSRHGYWQYDLAVDDTA